MLRVNTVWFKLIHRKLFQAAAYQLFNRRSRYLWLSLTIVLGAGVMEPALNPPAAEACFFWQACARQRGRASNTRAGGKRTGRIVGGNNASIPYVISPRNAWIQQPGPDHPYPIRWNPVEGADAYTVRIWRWTLDRDQPETILWQATTPDSSLPFPEEVFLEPGVYYSIEVATDSGLSSNLDEGYYESGFQLLFEEDYGELRSQLINVTPAVPTDPENTSQASLEEIALARAGVFFLEEMYADALAILQPLSESFTASDLVYTALCDTYSQSGLNQLAIEAYQQALALALANDDRLSEATIRGSLADVYAILGRFEDTLQQLRQTRDAYEQLNDDSAVVRLDRRINIISTRLLRQSDESSTP